MKRLALPCCIALLATGAQAQSVDINVGGFHTGVQVNEHQAHQQVTVQMPPARRRHGEGFRVQYQPSPQPMLAVAEPAGLVAQVWSERAMEGQFTTPFTFTGRPGRDYRVILTTPDGDLLLDQMVGLRRGSQAIITFRYAPMRPPPPMMPPQPMMPPPPMQAPPPVAAHHPRPPPAPMSPRDFSGLLSAVQHEAFSSDKLGLIQSATAGGAFFTCDQVGALVDALNMSSDKVAVVETTRDAIVDPANGFTLQKHFTFSSDKERVRELMSR